MNSIVYTDELTPGAKLYEDESFVAFSKPNGMLVHLTSIAADHPDEKVLLQEARRLCGRKLYPIHRIDRPTSGVVLFAFEPEYARKMQELMQQGTAVSKEYLALVRGWMKHAVDLQHPVKTEKGQLVEAHSVFDPIDFYEYPVSTDRYSCARFSLIRCVLFSGRWHQLRQHLAHLRHYIVNDRVHGDGKQNKLMTAYLAERRMFLHAQRLRFIHPYSHQPICIEAPLPSFWDSRFVRR